MEPATPGLVSILIPCCGRLDYTKLCVPSVLRFSRDPFELIFIDVGSLDGTADYLAGLAAAARIPVAVVRAPTDAGIPEACRKAFTGARGSYLALLNNDVLVTEGWLANMIALAEREETIAMVGPMSNYAGKAQLVAKVPYRVGPRKVPDGIEDEFRVDPVPAYEYARRFLEQHRGRWFKVDRLGGFCLLLKRRLLDKIPMGKELGLELFDSDFLSLKAREAGLTLACCGDVFVHNFGVRSSVHGGPE